MIEDPTIESVTLTAQVDRADVSRKVERAVELNRKIKESVKELDLLKAELRDIAKTGMFPKTETGAVEIRALESELCVTVTYPKDTPAIIKGVDVEPVVLQLTTGQFDLLFRHVTVMQPVEKFEQSFQVLPKKVQNLVKRIVKWVPNTPQVNLSK